jgi:glycosyltransferase involved in cell wall biosynthesis
LTASVIIPCHNAERWIGEAVDSCLNQTYQPIEIVAVDDGSTDASLAVLRSYGAAIKLLSGPNRGGNHARNHGFAHSRGEYIQFLDADDYLLPEKIGRQVAFLEQTGADVVYGDWLHRFEHPDGTSTLSEESIAGEQLDVLEALLAGWWTANMTLLTRRHVVERCGGWDESIKVGQDRDFFVMVSILGVDIRYQPGCHSVYRRYGDVTLSTSSRRIWSEEHLRVLEKAEHQLAATGRFVPRYRVAMAKSYFHLARAYYDLDAATYERLLEKTLELSPDFRPDESRLYNAVWRLSGFAGAEKLAKIKREVRGRVRQSASSRSKSPEPV